jgi:hypothetical protein
VESQLHGLADQGADAPQRAVRAAARAQRLARRHHLAHRALLVGALHACGRRRCSTRVFLRQRATRALEVEGRVQRRGRAWRRAGLDGQLHGRLAQERHGGRGQRLRHHGRR